MQQNFRLNNAKSLSVVNDKRAGWTYSLRLVEHLPGLGCEVEGRRDEAGVICCAVKAQPAAIVRYTETTPTGPRSGHRWAGKVHVPGPRTIKATIRLELPKGFQTSEFLLERGFVDRIVPRSRLKSEIARAIDYCGK